MNGINTRPKRSAMRRFWHDVTRDRQLYVLILPAFLIVLFFKAIPHKPRQKTTKPLLL